MQKYSLLIVFCCVVASATAQPIFIDQPIQAGELLVFPHITDTSKFYYLPNKLALGTDSKGKMQFSFLRYVQNVKTEAGQPTRTEGDGGGIVHALVALQVTNEQINRAQAELKKKVKNTNAVIVGPIIYKGGNFALISSFAEEGTEFTKKVVGVGRAPVFVGNKAACSMRLTKLGSKILWESCKTPTPDLSFSFTMDFSGYRSPMNARIEVDWDKVYTHEGFSAGIGINTGYVGLGVDIKAAFDELREQGAIKVINFGADDKMEALIETAYKKIVDMMFEPFSMPPSEEESTISQIAQGLGEVAKASRSSASLVSLNFAYEMKKQKKSGKYVIDLSKSTQETISFRFDENLGSEVSKCKECFREVNLDQDFYRQREILVSVDGLNTEQFSKYINFVTVSLKKKHGGKEDVMTTDEVRIAQKEFQDAAGSPFQLLYGWKDAADKNRSEWLTYEYKTVWSFFGDHTVESDWTPSDRLGLNAAPPFHPMNVSVEADPNLLKDQGIRVATVKFYYDYGAGEKVEQVTIKGTDPQPAQLAEFMLKQGKYDFEYEIIWRLFGNKTLTSGRKKSSDSLLYIDEVPADATPVNN